LAVALVTLVILTLVPSLQVGAAPRVPPTPPTDVDATALEAYARVTWTASFPQGTAVVGYRVTATPGGAVVVVGPGTTEAEFFGLTNGIAYQFYVVALSAHGDSPPGISNVVRPTVCGAPRGPGPFIDVADTHVLCHEIEWMAGAQITSALPDGTFRPAATLTRQTMAAFLTRALAPPIIPVPFTPTFSDVPVSHPFYAEIEWLVAQSIASGFADGTFRPTLTVSRQAMAAFLYRAAGSPPVLLPLVPTFSDVPLNHPFATPIYWMVAEGITSGYGDGTFRPTRALTRAEASAFLFRYLEE
jgi:hypothetical protein